MTIFVNDPISAYGSFKISCGTFRNDFENISIFWNFLKYLCIHNFFSLTVLNYNVLKTCKLSLVQICEMLQKHYMFQNATCAQRSDKKLKRYLCRFGPNQGFELAVRDGL